MTNIKSRLINFIRYHNAFTIGLVLVFFGGGLIFASDDAREAVGEVIGREVINEQGVDNRTILAANLENFDFGMKIGNVSEDDKNYYVEYSFNTLGILDNAWQPTERRLSMIIDKSSLNGQDLGLYVQKQLNEVAQNELVYLKTVQTAELEKGKTEIVRTTEYTGLIGLVLDTRSEILPGYEPVVKNETIQPPAANETNNSQPPAPNNPNSDQPPAASNNQPPVTNNDQPSNVNNDQLSVIDGDPVPSDNATATPPTE